MGKPFCSRLSAVQLQAFYQSAYKTHHWYEITKQQQQITLNCTCIDVRIAETSYVGLQRFCSMSRQMLPSAYTVQYMHIKAQSLYRNITVPFPFTVIQSFKQFSHRWQSKCYGQSELHSSNKMCVLFVTTVNHPDVHDTQTSRPNNDNVHTKRYEDLHQHIYNEAQKNNKQKKQT